MISSQQQYEPKECLMREMNAITCFYVLSHRLVRLEENLGINKESIYRIVGVIQPVFYDLRIQKMLDFSRNDKQRYNPQELELKFENEWKHRFQNQEMFKSVPNYINSIKKDKQKLAQYCQAKALKYLKNYSVVAKLVEAHKRKEAEKMKDDVSGNNLREDEEDEILAHYLEIMKKMEKYLNMMMETSCVPIFLKSVNDAEVTDALNRLPNVKSIVQKTKGNAMEHVLDWDSELSDFEQNTELLIRRSYSNPFHKGSIKSNMERRESELKPTMEELNKIKEEQQKITKETPTESRLSLYMQEFVLLEYYYVKKCRTKYLETIFDSQRELRNLCKRILDAEYDWMQQFRTKKKIGNISNFSLPHIIDLEQMETPGPFLAMMTLRAIRVILTAIKLVNKTHPKSFQILPVSNERLQLVKSEGIWTGWHDDHFKQIGLTAYKAQLTEEMKKAVEAELRRREIESITSLQNPRCPQLTNQQENEPHIQTDNSERLPRPVQTPNLPEKPQPVQTTWKSLPPHRPLLSSKFEPPQKQQSTPPCPESSNTNSVNSTDAGKVGKNQKMILEPNVIKTNELPALAHLEQPTGTVVLQPSLRNPSEEQQVAEHGLEEPNVQQQEPQTQPVVVEDMEVGDDENVVNDLHAFENEPPRQQMEAPNHPIAVHNGKVGDIQHVVSDPHVIEAKEPATKYDEKEVKEILAKKKKHSRLSLPIRILRSILKMRIVYNKAENVVKKRKKRNRSTPVALESSAKPSDTAGNSGYEKDKHVVEKNEETNPEKTHSDAHHTNQMTTQNSTSPDQLPLSLPFPHISSKLLPCMELPNLDHAQLAVAVHTELNVNQPSNTVVFSTEAGKAMSLQKVLHSQATSSTTREPDEPPDQEAAICVDANGKNQNVALKSSASEASDPSVSAHLAQPTQTAVLQPLEVEDVPEPQQIVQGELEVAIEQHAGPANQPVAVQNEEIGDVKNVVPDPHAIETNGSATNLKYDKKEVKEILAKKKKHSRLSLPIRILHSVPKLRLLSKKYKDAIKKREKRKKSTIVALEPSGTPNDTTGYSGDEKDEHVVEKNEETNPEKTQSAHSNRMTTQNSTLPNNVQWFSLMSELLNVDEQAAHIPQSFPRARLIQKVRISANTNRPTVHRISRAPVPAESTSLGISNSTASWPVF